MKDPNVAPRRSRVLLVGRGAPEQGGIAVFLDGLLTGPLGDEVELSLLNLTRSTETDRGGIFSLSNVRRTLVDGWRVYRGAAGVDLVHIHSALGATSTALRAGWLAWCARRRGRPVVLHAHGGAVISWLESGRARRVLRASTMPFDEVIVVSDLVAAAIRSAVRRPVTFVPNGVDLRPYQAVPDLATAGLPRVLYVGHLTRRKGLVDLRDASRILHRRGVEHEIVVAGGVPDEGAGEGALVEQEIGEDVTLLGRVEHDSIPDVLGTATIFCLPSWWEAMPLSVIEAMAAGRAVVATSVGDVPRMVADGVTGTLVPPRDPAALADALQSLLVDPQLCAAFGAAGRRRAASLFDANDMSRRLLDRYSGLVADRRSADEAPHQP